MKYSILKYGSSVRGDNDHYSDKDLLLVVENINDFKKIEKAFIKESWSISYYTYDKLQYLANNGFLFIKHLINEGKIEHDTNNRLQNILRSFKENKDYFYQLKKTKEFFNFVHTIPCNDISFSWLCDNIYVNFRNHLIYKSAIEGNYFFSYLDLINQLYISDLISKKDLEILIQLRVIKSCYRNNFTDIVPSHMYTRDLIGIMNKLDITININFASINNLNEIYDLNKISNPYKKLRLIELQFKNLNIDDKEMEKYISNPQFYANCKSIIKVTKKFAENLEKQTLTHKKKLKLSSNLD